MENYTRIIGTTSNKRVPTTTEIGNGNVTLTPYETSKNNGFMYEMSQQIGNISQELTNLIIAAGIIPVSGDLTQVLQAILNYAQPSGSVIQIVSSEPSAVATGSTITPDDNTIPQNNEGNEYMSLSITPHDVNNILQIDVVANFAMDAATNACVALHQDSIVNALAAQRVAQAAIAGRGNIASFTHRMIAGSISPITMKVRIGPDSAATVTFNGVGGNGRYGGVMASSIRITEIKA